MIALFNSEGRRRALDATSGAAPGPANARHVRCFIVSCFAFAIAGLDAGGAGAQDVVKLGLVMPMTGALASNGREAVAAAKLYIAQHGDTVAGKKIEIIVKDDASIPDNGKRLAQELIVNDKVSLLGAGVTPTAMSMAPIVTEAKIATVVMISGTSVVTERSPYYVRTSFTLGQQSGIIADWAIQNGSKKVVSIFSDFAPGAEAAKVFEQHLTKGGGRVLDTLKVPLANPDFAPFLQRARDHQPDTLFVFLPAGHAGPFARQFVERGLDKTGMKLIGTGDIVDDDDLPNFGELSSRGRDCRLLLRRAPLRVQQAICRGLQKGHGAPSELHFSRRLRWHAPYLRNAEKDRKAGPMPMPCWRL